MIDARNHVFCSESDSNISIFNTDNPKSLGTGKIFKIIYTTSARNEIKNNEVLNEEMIKILLKIKMVLRYRIIIYLILNIYITL